MLIKDILTQNVEMAAVEETLQAVAVKMRTRDVGALPVHDGASAVGIVTDRDITVRGVAEGKAPDRTPIKEVMTPGLETLKMDQTVEEGAQLMKRKQIRRALVIDHDGQVAGIISLGDLSVRVPEAGHDLGGKVLEHVSAPTTS